LLKGIVLAVTFLVCFSEVKAQDVFHIGVRANLVTAGGEPANDILSYGLQARYRLNERWLIGAALDEAEYDFELPLVVLGLEQDPGAEPIDATVSSTMISGWVERELGRNGSSTRWFWTAGAGVAEPDVDDLTGPLLGGGVFALTTDAGSEVIVSLSGGVRRNVGSHFSLEFALRADHHISEWDVRDRVSGRTGKTGDYTGLGAHGGFGFRF